ncbi:hypothetical protein [Clostridium merdae]|uniref:hypothetical protein n=1 Tax=Clostridium merdae TaxID=1958780 RepID=UPI000A26CC0F|nr:hypothetical protein [Clostridium merdae]
MNRVSGIALCLTAFILMWGCTQSLEKEGALAPAKDADVLEVQSFVQKQPLSSEEVKEVVQGLLDQAKQVQTQITEEDLSGATQRSATYFSADAAPAGGSATGQASKATQQGLRPITSGEYNSSEKIRTVMQSIYTNKAADEYCAELFKGSDPILKEIDGVLYFSEDQAVLSPEAMDYMVDTSVIMRQTVDEITVEMTMQTQGSTAIKKSLHLKKQGEEWRLDSVVFPQRIQDDGN